MIESEVWPGRVYSVGAALAAASNVQPDPTETEACSTETLGDNTGGGCCIIPAAAAQPVGLATGLHGGLLGLPILNQAATAAEGGCGGS